MMGIKGEIQEGGASHPWNRISRISGCSCTNLTPGPSALLSIRKMHPHTYTASTACQQAHLMCKKTHDLPCITTRGSTSA